MPYIKYREQRFNSKARKTIEQAKVIIADIYEGQGYTLTLRQLYYQMVAANMIANNEKEYKRLGRIVCDAREVGQIDWYAIEDRGRNCYLPGHTPTAAEVLKNIEYQLRLNPWLDQDVYLVVGVEKAALEGVIERPASRWRAPYMACRGYLSASEAWRSGRRFERAKQDGKRCVFLHLGDHDPSGIHMTGDNRDRLNLFAHGGIEVNRLALNMDQVEQYDLPENPAKQSDMRFAAYVAEFETESSWELDALSPKVIDELVHEAIKGYVDQERWEKTLAEEADRRQGLRLLGMRWEEVEKLVLGDELNAADRLKLLDALADEVGTLLVTAGHRIPMAVKDASAATIELCSDAAVSPKLPDFKVEGAMKTAADEKTVKQAFGTGFERGVAEAVREVARVEPIAELCQVDADVVKQADSLYDRLQVVQNGRQSFERPEPVKPSPSPFEASTDDLDEPEEASEADPTVHPDGFDPDEPLPDGFEEG